MNTRIKILRKELKLNQTEFGERIGYKQAAVGLWENGRNTIPESAILLICNEYNVNEEWLRTGKGEMFSETLKNVIDEMADTYNLNDFDKDLITLYATLSEEQRQSVQDFARKLFTTTSPTQEELSDNILEFPSKEETTEIPLMGNTAAGNPMELIEGLYTGDTLTVPSSLKGCFALKVCGDSMEPSIPYGSYVAVKQQSAVECGEIGIFYINGEVTCKKYKIKNGVAELHSTNPKYKPITFHDYDDARVLGKVIDLI